VPILDDPEQRSNPLLDCKTLTPAGSFVNSIKRSEGRKGSGIIGIFKREELEFFK
jgi:hypothetical protein